MKLFNLIQKSTLSNKVQNPTTLERKLYTGVGQIKVVEINPTLDMFDKEYMEDFKYMKPQTEPDYAIMKDGERIGTRFTFFYKAVMPDVDVEKEVEKEVEGKKVKETVVEKEAVEAKGKFDIAVFNKYKVSKDNSKIEVMNGYGDTSWLTFEQDAEGNILLGESSSPYFVQEEVYPIRIGESSLLNALYILSALREENIKALKVNKKVEEDGLGEDKKEPINYIWLLRPEGFDEAVENLDFTYFHNFTEQLRAFDEEGAANLMSVYFMIRDNKYQDIYTSMFALPGMLPMYDKTGVLKKGNASRILKAIENDIKYRESRGEDFPYVGDMTGIFKKWTGENNSNQKDIKMNTSLAAKLPGMGMPKTVGAMPKNNMLPKK